MSHEDIREISEGLQYQGSDEEVAYNLTTTKWGSSPTSPTVKVYSVVGTTYTDVTATVMPSGSATVTGDVITLPVLKLLTADTLYRVEVKFTVSGNVFEPYAMLRCKR